MKLTPGIYLIPLSNSHDVVFVDEIDFNFLKKFKWHKSSLGYAVKKTPKNDIDSLALPYITRMHCIVAGTLKNMTTDHINGNKLDNRRCNLRLCTKRQNLLNRKRKNVSGFKGVSRNSSSNKWRARIMERHIGNFDTKEEAAKAYNEAAKKEFGEYAWLN